MFVVTLKSPKDDSELMMKTEKDLLYFLVPGGNKGPATPGNPFLFFLSLLFFSVSSLPLTHTPHTHPFQGFWNASRREKRKETHA